MKTEKKYKLTDEFIIIDDKKLYRIEALIDFSDVKKEDKGGFIESENNLSHNGNCWVYDDAEIFDNARILNNAEISGNAKVYGDAKIDGNSGVYDSAKSIW